MDRRYYETKDLAITPVIFHFRANFYQPARVPGVGRSKTRVIQAVTKLMVTEVTVTEVTISGVFVLPLSSKTQTKMYYVVDL